MHSTLCRFLFVKNWNPNQIFLPLHSNEELLQMSFNITVKYCQVCGWNEAKQKKVKAVWILWDGSVYSSSWLPTCSAPSCRKFSHLVPSLLLEVETLNTADSFGRLTSNHHHHLNAMRERLKTPKHITTPQWWPDLYLWAGDGRSHPGPSGLHQSSLVSWQQVVLHGLDQVVFTCTAVLYQGLLLYTLTAQEEPIKEQN